MAAEPLSPSRRVDSLVRLCRRVITEKLDRYPPEAFNICDLDEWQALVALRHQRTQPKNANKDVSGALDDSGRLVPAVSEKFISAVEECNEHLAECSVADELLWKDCVEFKFSRSGIARPVAFMLPWPLLVDRIKKAAEVLLDSESSPEIMQESIHILLMSPMNITLLKDSGAGKLVKKAVKRKKGLSDAFRQQLNDILESWISMAASNGVYVKMAAKNASPTHEDDLKLAESCQTWRQLFALLKDRHESIRSNQGKRMREIRKNVSFSCALRFNLLLSSRRCHFRCFSFCHVFDIFRQLAQTRPKLVKVRPSTAKQQRILEQGLASTPGNAKLVQLRQETSIQTTRQGRSPAIKPKSSFGDAVAFAAVSKKGAWLKRKNVGGKIHQLGGGKRIKVPDKVVAAAGPRAVASKWKKIT
jgi:hypothetical protein